MFSTETMRGTAHWLIFYGRDLEPPETPERLHSHTLGPDGRPRWAAEFTAYLSRDDLAPKTDADESRIRTERAMRRLRSLVVREYECLVRLLVVGETTEELQQWLNDRAIRNGIPLPPGRTEHYTDMDVMALVICGVEFLNSVY